MTFFSRRRPPGVLEKDSEAQCGFAGGSTGTGRKQPGAMSPETSCHLQAPSPRKRALAPPSQAKPGLVGPVTQTRLMNGWRPLTCLFHLKGGACIVFISTDQGRPWHVCYNQTFHRLPWLSDASRSLCPESGKKCPRGRSLV